MLLLVDAIIRMYKHAFKIGGVADTIKWELARRLLMLYHNCVNRFLYSYSSSIITSLDIRFMLVRNIQVKPISFFVRLCWDRCFLSKFYYSS